MAYYRAIGDEEIGNCKHTAMQGHTAATTTQAQSRRKGIGTRIWLVVSAAGRHVEEVGKHSIMRRTGLPARDLRVLDPVLSYPSTILGRERAIVVNLEHIKAILTAKEVFMVTSNNPLVVDFVDDLQHRLSVAPNHHNGVPPHHQETTEINNDTDHMDDHQQLEVTWNSHRMLHRDDNNSMKNSSRTRSPRFSVGSEIPTPESESSARTCRLNEHLGSIPKQLPFEFRALEACLESACRCLDSETLTLEQEAYPALDELTSQISTLNLERVRQIKSRLVAISGRVQKVRDELEHLLDDDNDMAEMYLTEKLSSCQSMDRTSGREELNSSASEVDDDRAESKSERDTEIFSRELEMLLEAYFAQIDGILHKLSTMSEYVDDTEDCINIMLDDKQNQLLQMGVMLSTAILIINAGIVVVGLFGMNIHIPLFDGQPIQFWETTIGTILGCILLCLLAYGWGKKRSLFA
ncbi:hypothetical protein Dimus_021594 [Dionaea muscipula]